MIPYLEPVPFKTSGQAAGGLAHVLVEHPPGTTARPGEEGYG